MAIGERMTRKEPTMEMLQAAVRVFNRQGFHATRMQDIADEVGMGKASLYHYISKKEDLLHGLIESAIERMISETESVIATSHPAQQKLVMAIETNLRRSQEDRDIWGVLQREDVELFNRNSTADILKLIKSYEDLWKRIFDQGVEEGDLDPNLDARVVVQALLGMSRSVYSWFRPDGRLPIQEVARILSEIALRGVRRPIDATSLR
jgi:AcrR family transcriptional regulator